MQYQWSVWTNWSVELNSVYICNWVCPPCKTVPAVAALWRSDPVNRLGSQLMHGIAVQGEKKRKSLKRSWLKRAWCEGERGSHLADLSGWAVAALCCHIPLGHIEFSSHTSRGKWQEGRMQPFISAKSEVCEEAPSPLLMCGVTEWQSGTWETSPQLCWCLWMRKLAMREDTLSY